MRAMKFLAAIAVCVIALVAQLPAMQSNSQSSKQSNARSSTTESSPTLESVRQRWERLPPEEQARLREIYERYRSLSEDERRALIARSRRVSEEKERVRAQLSDEARANLQKLAPEKRREVLHDLVEGVARDRGARIREKMPEAWINRLDEARPEDRARYLADFQHQARERVARGAIDKIGRKLELSKDEVERLKALPEPQRAASVLELRNRLSTKDAAEFGLPPGVTQAQWNEWQALPPEEFFEVMQRYRREHEWQQAERSGDPQTAPSPERVRAYRALEEALRPRALEFVQLADLSPAERRQRLAELRRARVMVVLRDNALAAPERLAELARLPEGEFVRALREIFPAAPLGKTQRGHHAPDMDRRQRRQ